MAPSKRNQLRKQPKRQRTHLSSATKIPPINVPPTAKKRRRRQRTEGVRFGLATLKRIVFSSRWVSLGLLALTIFALVIIVQERRFYLTYIPVEGAVSFEAEEIVAASNLAGRHIFAADPSEAAAAITELPGVISSTVSLKWPNQVMIEITEEAPVAVWQENGVSYGITDGGRLIPVGFPLTGLLQIMPDTSSKTPAVVSAVEEDLGTGEAADGSESVEEVPTVEETAAVDETETDVAEPAVESDGGNTNGTEETVATEDRENSTGDEAVDSDAAVSGPQPSIAFVPQEVLLGALSLRELRPNINELYYRPSEGLTFQDGRGWRVHFGTGTDMNQKLVLYETILNDLLTRGIDPIYISVSNKEKPYYLAQ